MDVKEGMVAGFGRVERCKSGRLRPAEVREVVVERQGSMRESAGDGRVL